ncbi:TPA: type II toxin-antitoxin system RnlA family toxin [Vibrio alginolyticus]
MSDYKSLPLAQELLSSYIDTFVTENSLRIDVDETKEYTSGSGNRVHRYSIGQVSTPSALIDFICNRDGTMTIHYQMGRNQVLGLEIAKYIKSQIDPNEFESVEMTLRDIKLEDIEPLINSLKQDKHEDDSSMFSLVTEHDDDNLLQIRVQSLKYLDCLVIKQHKKSHSFQMQGRPLFVYKRMCYHFLDHLDIMGIEKVLNRVDETRAQIVSDDVATEMLKLHFPETFERAPDELKRLILSGMCVTLSSPKLSDYSMLVYPDLRALEGAMHDCFSAYGIYSSNFTSDNEERVGVLFRKLADSTYTLKSEHVSTIGSSSMVKALDDAYNQYSGKRHPLFHLQEALVFSTFITDLSVAVSLINDTRNCIEELYKNRP